MSDAPIIIPQTMDALLEQRKDARKIADAAWQGCRVSQCRIQYAWIARLNEFIRRRAEG